MNYQVFGYFALLTILAGVIFGIAPGMVLLTGAGLMIRSFLAAQSEFAGIDASHILTARLNLPKERYPKPEGRRQFYEKLQTRMAAIPGAQMTACVCSAAATSTTPMACPAMKP